jgi:hypothetical protein
MGAFYTVLVDSSVGLDEAPGEAARMVNWLQERGIIASTEVEKGSAESPDGSDNQVENTVYRPGPNFLEASDDADDPRFSILRLEDNSLEVVQRGPPSTQVIMASVSHCPKCATEQSEQGDEWNNAFQTWWEGHPEPLVCVECGNSAHLSGWRFDPVFGFGNLGFSFHNSALRPEFVKAFERELGRPLTVVHEHP